MKNVISLIILSSVLLSGCASTLGGSTSPEDLLTKDVSGKYTTKNEMIEVFDCLTRWVGTKMPFALRREITSDGAQGHLFWKDGMGWNNWTYFFQKAQDDKDHTFSLYVSANVAWHAGYLKEAGENCANDASSWPDSDF
mgnify:CR=1 FL=1